MSLRSYEASILSELRREAGCSRVRQKDIMEWSTSPVNAQDGETVVYLPLNRVHVAYKLPPKVSAASVPQEKNDNG